jgi:hypothetical protein
MRRKRRSDSGGAHADYYAGVVIATEPGAAYRSRLGLGDLDSARGLLRESVKHAAALDNTRECLARALDALAAVAVAAADFEHGATMLGAAEGVRQSIGAVLWVTDRSRHADTETQLQVRLSDSAYTEAIQRGRNLSLTEVLELTRLGDE